MTAPVVLVHGAWHGPWCWERVEALLRVRGIESHAVDLPTCQPERTATTLHDDAAMLAVALDALDGSAVVVGHSYGGMVITEGAAGHANARPLVYLAAFMPDKGESMNSLAISEPNPALFGAFGSQNGRSVLKPEAIGPVLYGDCDETTIDWAASRVRSMLGGASDAAVEIAWRNTPSTYVVCIQDRTVPPALQRRMAAHAGDVVEWDTSHSPFASRPDLVADLIESLTRD